MGLRINVNTAEASASLKRQKLPGPSSTRSCSGLVTSPFRPRTPAATMPPRVPQPAIRSF